MKIRRWHPGQLRLHSNFEVLDKWYSDFIADIAGRSPDVEQ